MIETLTALFTVFTSGAGGGILGLVGGLFKQSQEKKERIEMARIDLERDIASYGNDDKERAHSLLMLDKGATLEIEKVKTESEAAIDIENQKALSSAQDVFKSLNTTSGMDNYRASVRPTLAYWSSILFTCVLCWTFYEFKEQIDESTGKQILIGLFATLTFIVTSVTTFYYVSRRNTQPNV